MNNQEISVNRKTFLKDIELGNIIVLGRVKSNLFNCEYYTPSGYVKYFNVTTF